MLGQCSPCTPRSPHLMWKCSCCTSTPSMTSLPTTSVTVPDEPQNLMRVTLQRTCGLGCCIADMVLLTFKSAVLPEALLHTTPNVLLCRLHTRHHQRSGCRNDAIDVSLLCQSRELQGIPMAGQAQRSAERQLYTQARTSIAHKCQYRAGLLCHSEHARANACGRSRSLFEFQSDSGNVQI
jgi:hypothetical protein